MLIQWANSLLVFSVSGVTPWTIHAEELRATALVNVDAERKVTQLSEEVRELHREIKKRVSLFYSFGIREEARVPSILCVSLGLGKTSV